MDEFNFTWDFKVPSIRAIKNALKPHTKNEYWGFNIESGIGYLIVNYHNGEQIIISSCRIEGRNGTLYVSYYKGYWEDFKVAGPICQKRYKNYLIDKDIDKWMIEYNS